MTSFIKQNEMDGNKTALIYDCVVVGAGVSGLTAANELNKQCKINNSTGEDFKILVLEAADYVGGRVCTKTLGSTKVGVGARFVHGNENSILYNLYMKMKWQLDVLKTDYPSHLYDPTTLGTKIVNKVCYESGDENESTDLEKTSAPSLKQGKDTYDNKNIDIIFRSLMQLSEENVTYLSEETKLQNDAKSLEEYLLENGLDKSYLPLANAVFSNDRCASIDSAGLYECQLAEENWVYGHFDALPKNFEPLIDYLSKDIKSSIKVSSIVTSIKRKKTKKNNQKTDNRIHQIDFFDNVEKCMKHVDTKTVIVSVPLPVLKRENIAFKPPLSQLRMKAINCIQALPLILFTLRFSKRPWPENMIGAQIACGGECLIPDITLMEGFDKEVGTVCTATCFIGAKKAYEMTELSKEESVRVALIQLDEMFHNGRSSNSGDKANVEKKQEFPKASEVYVDSILEDWGKRPFVWCGYTSPSLNSLIDIDTSSANKHIEESSTRLSARQILAQPHENSIFFCGEATFQGQDAALQSVMTTGNRAAREVKQYLNYKQSEKTKGSVIREHINVEKEEKKTNVKINNFNKTAVTSQIAKPFLCNYTSIGRIKSIFPSCRGTPRQGYLMPSSKASLILHQDISEDVLIGLEDYEYVWIIFHFHKNKQMKLSKQELSNKIKREKNGLPPKRLKFKAKVRPPKIDEPNRRIGVFACRTPHRPNAIGLSVAKILNISLKNKSVLLGGLDLVDETPVLDIKPYVPTYDAIPGATIPKWVSKSLSDCNQPVEIEESVREKISMYISNNINAFDHFKTANEVCQTITEMLKLDITSGQTSANGKIKQKREDGWEFCVSVEKMTVVCKQYADHVSVVDCILD
jgi:tRNA-Thr(GGU) m(6)t(6)A37 methyltransferase TsaA